MWSFEILIILTATIEGNEIIKRYPIQIIIEDVDSSDSELANTGAESTANSGADSSNAEVVEVTSQESPSISAAQAAIPKTVAVPGTLVMDVPPLDDE